MAAGADWGRTRKGITKEKAGRRGGDGGATHSPTDLEEEGKQVFPNLGEEVAPQPS